MFTLDFEYTLNGKETVPKRGSNVFLKSRIFEKFNLIGHKYWTLSLILSGMLFFTWYYLNSLTQKEFYFVNLEPTNILPCFAHVMKTAFFAVVSKNQKSKSLWERYSLFLWNYVYSKELWCGKDICYTHPYPLNPL